VTDTVTWSREVCTEFTGRRTQEAVIVSILKVELIGLVVAVLCSKFGLDFVEAERLELEPDERSCRILSEDLIDLDPDLLAGFEFALDEMLVEDLFGKCLSHSV